MSVVRFVLKHVKEDTAWGDLARDFKQSGIRRTLGYKSARRYMEDMGTGFPALAVLEEMNDAYKRIFSMV